MLCFFLRIRRPPRSTQSRSSAASDVYKRQEFEAQDTYPSVGASWARFFRNQEGLRHLRVSKDLGGTLKGADAVVLAVRHAEYLGLDPDLVVEMTGAPVAVIDCFGILDDRKIRRFFELGCEVKGLGRGHIQRIKEEVRSRTYSQARAPEEAGAAVPGEEAAEA